MVLEKRWKAGALLRLAVLAVVAGLVVSCAPPAAAPGAAPTPAAKAPATSPASSEAKPAIRDGGTLVVGVNKEGDSLFSLFTGFNFSGQIIDLIYDPLVRLNDKGDFVPALATEVPTEENGGISKDGLTYTFHLRKGVKFHDGQPLTCKDVEYSFAIAKNPKVKVAYASDFSAISTATCTDDFTPVFRLTEPYLGFLTVIAKYPALPKHVLEKEADINATQLIERPMGTGPFVFKEWSKGSYIIVERNPDYFLGRPHLEKIVQKAVPDMNTMLAQVQRGEIDVWIDESGSQFEIAKNFKDYDVTPLPVMAQEFMSFNLLEPRLVDKQVRQALAYAIDRDAIIKVVVRGVAQPNPASPLVPTGYYFKKDVKDYKFDPARARAILDEAGWKPGPDGIRAKAGQKLSFKVQAPSETRVKIAEMIVSQWKAIGVEGIVEPGDAATMFAARRQHRFEVSVSPFSQLNETDMRFILHSKESNGGSNVTAWRNPEVDGLLDRAAAATNRAQKKELYDKIQDIFSDELPYFPLFQQAYMYTVRKMVHNFRPNPNKSRVISDFWNAYEWWKE